MNHISLFCKSSLILF